MTRPHRARPAPEALLERRYRLLLTWYPADYRAANIEEMLGVALARATVGQRWPGAGEAANLVLSGQGCGCAGCLPACAPTRGGCGRARPAILTDLGEPGRLHADHL
jgi:hypothetical protein